MTEKKWTLYWQPPSPDFASKGKEEIGGSDMAKNRKVKYTKWLEGKTLLGGEAEAALHAAAVLSKIQRRLLRCLELEQTDPSKARWARIFGRSRRDLIQAAGWIRSGLRQDHEEKGQG